MKNILLLTLFSTFLMSFLSCKSKIDDKDTSPDNKVTKMMKAIKDLHIMRGSAPETVMNEQTLDKRMIDLNKIRNGIRTNYMILQNKDLSSEEIALTERLFEEDKRIKNDFKDIQGKKFNEAIPMLTLLIDQAKAINKALAQLKQKHTPNS